MTSSISKTPTWVLFIASILPIIFISNDAKVWAITNIILFLFFSLWVYSITTQLTTKIKYASTFNANKFVTILILSMTYIVLISIYYIYTSDNYEEPKWLFAIIIPGNIFLGYAYFYLLNYISKIISTAELKKPVKFDQYANYFFCLLFFPIGIWWVNSKIRLLIERE